MEANPGFLIKRILEMPRNFKRAPEILAAKKEFEDWARVVSTYLGYPMIQFPYLLQTKHYGKLQLTEFSDLITAWIIYLRQEYPIRGDEKVILDVGANIGAFSVFAGYRCPSASIYALEPFPTTFRQLYHNIEINNLQQRVRIHSLALAGHSGERIMSDVDSEPSHKRHFAEDNGNGTTVKTLSLADFLTQEQIDVVDFLKMDIEGAEHEVILSTPAEVLQKFGIISMEFHRNRSHRPLFCHIIDSGFKLVEEIKGEHPDGGNATFERR